MATNLALDDELVVQARKVGGHKTKREAVTTALREYVRRRRAHKMLDWVGKVEYWPTTDYKQARRRG